MKTVKKMQDLTASEAAALASAAAQIGIPKEWLFGLIMAESGWNPTIKNPRASARGLIQWVDATAQHLGYANSADLIAKNPTREAQLTGPVVKYLKMWAPIKSPESLAAANFYPAYRNKLDTPLPPEVQRVNPGIRTVRDYFDRHLKKKIPGYVATAASVTAPLLIAGTIAFF